MTGLRSYFQPGLSVFRGWKSDGEVGALTLTATFGVNRPSMELYETSHDGEA